MIYEFSCKKCGNVFEMLTKDRDNEYQPCPLCSCAAKKIISLSNIRFKGVGWYGNSTEDYCTSDVESGHNKNEKDFDEEVGAYEI